MRPKIKKCTFLPETFYWEIPREGPTGYFKYFLIGPPCIDSMPSYWANKWGCLSKTGRMSWVRVSSSSTIFTREENPTTESLELFLLENLL